MHEQSRSLGELSPPSIHGHVHGAQNASFICIEANFGLLLNWYLTKQTQQAKRARTARITNLLRLLCLGIIEAIKKLVIFRAATTLISFFSFDVGTEEIMQKEGHGELVVEGRSKQQRLPADGRD